MENDVADIVKKAQQEWLIVSELRIEGSYIFLFGGDSQNNLTRVSRGQGKNGKNKKKLLEQQVKGYEWKQ